MNIVKKIGLRLGLLTLIVSISNSVYKFTFYQSDILENGNLLQKLETGLNSSDILLFSSSPNRAHPLTDVDTRSISKIIDDNLPKLTLTAIDTGAIHAGVFKKIINLIPKYSNLKYIIVNMNYRSFGIGWIMSDLENSIAKQSVFYSNYLPIINRLLQGLNYYKAIPNSERQQLMISSWKNSNLPFPPPKNTVQKWCGVEKWGDWTDPKRNLADHFIKNYAFVLNKDNIRVKDFDEIVDVVKNKNIQLIFNILGENIEKTNYLVDTDLTDLMIQNKNYLIKRYSKQGVIIVDNFNLIPDSCFYEKNFPTEHYTYIGREIIAKNIVQTINDLEKN